MRVVVVAGSHRPKGETGRVARYLAERASHLAASASELIDLAGNPLPLWRDESHEKPTDRLTPWSVMSRQLANADALIFVTPEFGGMASPTLKNFFLHCEGGELAHKPSLIVAVSASQGGSFPVAELRMSSYKNTRVCHIPEHIIIRRVGELLHDVQLKSEDDDRLRVRIDYALRLLAVYAEALRQVRESGVPDHENFPYGM